MGLGDSTIWDANEAFYAETPREMIESGDYINPSFNYHPRFNKPVLSYWAVRGVVSHVGSRSTAAASDALAAIVLIATAFGLGRAVGSYEADCWRASFSHLAALPDVSRRIIIDMWTRCSWR